VINDTQDDAIRCSSNGLRLVVSDEPEAGEVAASVSHSQSKSGARASFDAAPEPAHYHAERNHQGLGDELIEPEDEVGSVTGKIECRERLGGLLKFYHRRAA
jgi:hypothetical protein